MQRTAAATSCIRATSDRPTGFGPMKAIAAGLAVAAGLVVFCPAQAQNTPRPAGADQNRVLLDTLNQVDALGRQVRELRGQVEDASNRIEQANDRAQKSEKRQSDLYNDTDGRLRRTEQLLKDDAAERKKLASQVAELELRLKKFEADLDVQIKKLEADVEARLRKADGAVAGAAGAQQVSELDARLKKLEHAGSSGASSADLEARIRKLEQLATAGAPATSADALPGAPSAPVAPVGGTSTSRPAPAPTTPAAPTTTARTEPAAGSQLPPASLNSPPDPQVVSRAYEQALGKQRSGDSAGAVQGFQAFLKQYPRHELAPNAQYWLGEAYFRLGDYPSAIAAQQKLLVTYPDHLKVPDAMLILANSQYAAGEAASARKTLEDIISKHPVSEAAEKAKQRLAKIK